MAGSSVPTDSGSNQKTALQGEDEATAVISAKRRLHAELMCKSVLFKRRTSFYIGNVLEMYFVRNRTELHFGGPLQGCVKVVSLQGSRTKDWGLANVNETLCQTLAEILCCVCAKMKALKVEVESD